MIDCSIDASELFFAIALAPIHPEERKKKTIKHSGSLNKTIQGKERKSRSLIYSAEVSLKSLSLSLESEGIIYFQKSESRTHLRDDDVTLGSL